VRHIAGACGCYISGFPVDCDGTRAQALEKYGPQLVNRVNFARGRIDPNFSLSATVAREWSWGDRAKMRLQQQAAKT
jgi:hypothetical protein